MTRQGAVALLLVVTVEVASALGVVWLRHQSRVAYTELRAVQVRIDAELDLWSRLQLQSATLAAAQRVEDHARRELRMHEPKRPRLLIVNDEGDER